MTDPKISIIIPLKQLSYYLIFECLPALESQTYKNFEVIVLPNEQVQYDLSLMRKYKFLRIIPTGKVTKPAEKRDLGAEKATGEMLAFLDDDAYPKNDWLDQAVKGFNGKNVAAVCGPGVLPKRAEYWEQVFDEVLKSWIGAAGYTYRFVPQKKRFVDDYPSMNFFIRKSLFQKLGGFNNDYWPGEDSKLCNDIVYKIHQKIVYDPSVIVYHHRRKDLESYLKQHGNYGFHRGAFFAHGDQNSQRLSYLAPTLFFLYVVIFIIVLGIHKVIDFPAIFLYIFSLPIVIYILLALQLMFEAFFDTLNLKIALGSVLTLYLTHLTYATMFMKGFTRGLDRQKSIYDQR